MPRGVYDRTHLKGRTKQKKNLTFSPELATRFWKLRDEAGADFPFELTNSQFFEMLLSTYEKQVKKTAKVKAYGSTTTGGWAS